MPVIKGPEVRVPLLEVLEIWEFESDRSNYIIMKNVYIETVSFTKSFAIHFDINGSWNFTEIVQVIVMEDMVSHACLR